VYISFLLSFLPDWRINVFITRGSLQSSDSVVKNTVATFFGNRVINVWNSLSPSEVDVSSLNKFRASLALVDLSEFLCL